MSWFLYAIAAVAQSNRK